MHTRKSTTPPLNSSHRFVILAMSAAFAWFQIGALAEPASETDTEARNVSSSAAEPKAAKKDCDTCPKVSASFRFVFVPWPSAVAQTKASSVRRATKRAPRLARARRPARTSAKNDYERHDGFIKVSK